MQFGLRAAAASRRLQLPYVQVLRERRTDGSLACMGAPRSSLLLATAQLAASEAADGRRQRLDLLIQHLSVLGNGRGKLLLNGTNKPYGLIAPGN
jgi:hypothetical protein